MTQTKSGKKSTKHLKVKKGDGEYLALRFKRDENPLLDRILKAENRLALKRDFGIVLPDDIDWPTSYGRYSDRMKVLLEYTIKEGQKRLKGKLGEESCEK